uniref:Uncharacterized protein n=1 Tax=Rhizophora mucronata TaxID=61149 RepID=A0A2P2IIR4_RHIMU
MLNAIVLTVRFQLAYLYFINFWWFMVHYG